jgi:hypothetical protein
MFFSRSKSANNTFQPVFSTKRTSPAVGIDHKSSRLERENFFPRRSEATAATEAPLACECTRCHARLLLAVQRARALPPSTSCSSSFMRRWFIPLSAAVYSEYFRARRHKCLQALQHPRRPALQIVCRWSSSC